MLVNRKTSTRVIISFVFLLSIVLFAFNSIQAQYWAALPPYNLMWPLWSPALSPTNPVSGLLTPLINVLNSNTILPVQPALVRDPYKALPWALYNTPIAIGIGPGLLYFGLSYGLNPFPPDYLLDPVTGTPNPIALPPGWSVYLPTSLSGFEYFIPLANSIYALRYGVPLINLLTSADIWGLPPL